MTTAQPGRFVWYELSTTDPAAAIAFYSDVAGWTTQKFEGADYTMWVGSQGPLGGVMLLNEEAKKMGAPPNWMANLEVADVDAAIETLRARGGQVYVPPQDVPDIGRFAIVADPQGAAIALFKPAKEMTSHDTSKAGEFAWHELMTTDLEAALRFYSEIVGWEKVSEMDMGEMGKYVLFGREGKMLGGMMTKPKEMPGPSAWLYYIRVTDLDAALERAKAKDARLLNGPMDVPGGERIAQLMDPQGAAFALVSMPPK
jgi:predicted enzyme related to lactoylglutathione lyase